MFLSCFLKAMLNGIVCIILELRQQIHNKNIALLENINEIL